VEIDDEESLVLARHQVYRFAAMVAFLVLMSSALGAMLYLSSSAAGQAGAGAVKARASQPTATRQSQGSPADGAESQESAAKTLAGSAKFLARLAWLSAALMGLTLLVLFWVVTHFILQRAGRNSRHERTQYVNAWSLAGQRVKPLEEDDPPDDADDDEGEQDDQDEDSDEKRD
jgi:hypothetical protein